MTETEAIGLFKCLADKSRLQILKSLAVEDMYVERLAQRLGVKVEILPADGGKEARALLRSGLHISRRRKPKKEETANE